ncbi:MAG: hypothetical protein QG670_2305 [Thermoproteota archaeon]|nr:hypothetical protein [Thermoproteota archaeon]
MSLKKKAPEKSEKPVVRDERAIRPRRNVPTNRVLTNFDDMLDDFRRRFQEMMWIPWELEGIEPFDVEFPIRETYSDIVDEGNKYVIRTETPGIPGDKIDVTVTKDSIEVSGEMGAEKENKEKNFIVRERRYSNIYKILRFPEEVIPEKAESTLKNGLLEVSIPKKTPTTASKRHKIEVKEVK